MDLRVIGCHGGDSAQHRTSTFLLDERIALDAGSLATGLDLDAQCRLEACLVSHAHWDHVQGLGAVLRHRSARQVASLTIAATRDTLKLLKRHYFNGVVWPDYTKPSSAGAAAVTLLPLPHETPVALGDYELRAVPVNHSIEGAGLLIRSADQVLAYSGDTGPTDRFWDLLNNEPRLRALLVEVTYPSSRQKEATALGHHTPKTLRRDLEKYARPDDLPTLLYHMHPAHQAELERECARMLRPSVTVTAPGDHFVI